MEDKGGPCLHRRGGIEGVREARGEGCVETRCCSCRPLCGEGMARVPAREEKVDGGGKGAVEVPVGISNSRLLRVHAQNQVRHVPSSFDV